MTGKRRLWRTCVALALITTVVACGSDEKSTDPGFAGHWKSTQWGDHYIRVEGSSMKVIYTHDNGRVVGTFDGVRFSGWWTESPSRQPSADAGPVEFTLTRTDDKRTIDGTWRYGVDGTPRENWDLVWVDAQIPADIAATFDDDAAFIEKP